MAVTLPTCWFVDTSSWFGIHYMSTPTITFTCVGANNTVFNLNSPTGITAVGATSWTVVDGNNVQVASGTMTTSTTAITVCTAGTWAGGTYDGGAGVGKIVPGYYTISTSAGTQGVVVGNCSISPATTHMWVPPSTPPAASATNLSEMAAWLGGSSDRDQYNLKIYSPYFGLGYEGTQWVGGTRFTTGSNIVTQAGGTISAVAITGSAGNYVVTVTYTSVNTVLTGDPVGFSGFTGTLSLLNGTPVDPATSKNCNATYVSATQFSINTNASSLSGTSAGTFYNPGGPLFDSVHLSVGQLVMSSSVAPGTTVTTMDASGLKFTMSNNATASISGAFCATPRPISGVVSDMVAQFNKDPYFSSTYADSARPHKKWMYPGFQSNGPDLAPDTSYWGQMALGMASNGISTTGSPVYYESPTNEPENGGWQMSATPGIISTWNDCANAIITNDANAQLLGYCSAGLYHAGVYANLATFLAGITHPLNAVSNHMEATNQSLPNLVALRQYYAAIKAQMIAGHTANPTNVPLNLDLWNTETGFYDNEYGVFHWRRCARNRTIMRFVMESFGWAKENSYEFTHADHGGSGLGSYLFDVWSSNYVSLRPAAHALHIQSEALYGTTCTPSSPPSALSFGPTGSLGDSMFMGLHYTSTLGRDVVCIATNGLESDTVTLNVSSTTGVYAWDGWGNTRPVTTSNNTITFAVDDLLTYVFLPASTTVTVADTGSRVVSKLNGAINLTRTAGSLVDNASTSIAGVPNDGNFGQNNVNISGDSVPSWPGAPYTTNTVPNSLTASSFATQPLAQNILGVVIFTGGQPFHQFGCTLTGFTLTATIGGVANVLIYTYAPGSTGVAPVSFPIPGPGHAFSPGTPGGTSRSSWWKSASSWIIPASAMSNLTGPITSITLNITSTSYGTMPDLAATQVFENATQQIQISEFQVLADPTTYAPGPQWLIRAVG